MGEIKGLEKIQNRVKVNTERIEMGNDRMIREISRKITNLNTRSRVVVTIIS